MSETPSAFWTDLAGKNRQMLEAEGIARFKRTVANNYFNWLITSARKPQFWYALWQWLTHPDLIPLRAKIGTMDGVHAGQARRLSLKRRQHHVYRLYVAFLWSIMCRLDTRGLRFQVEEPEIGDPIRIHYQGRLISQDLAHSIVEANSIMDMLPSGERPRVLELGAGYGRLAHVFTAGGIARQYVIVDIEPAISVSHWYLTQLFGAAKVRRTDRLPEDHDASVVLIDANAVETLPTAAFDVVLSISTLPEMTSEQAGFYLREFQRLSRNLIFLKQWEDWQNPSDGTHLRRADYTLGDKWRLVHDRSDPLIPNFFNRCWRLDSNPH